ncbi:hypothetical protein BGZ91_011178, partial [Linnemannia elongata]
LLLKQIPSNKIHFGKRILTVTEDKDDDKVHIQAADGTTYQGDILVGADGAYSAVRQRLYERLKAKSALPKADQEELPFSCTCLVGQTEPLDVEQFPELKDPLAPYWVSLGEDKPYTNSEWGPFAAQSMCDETRDFPIPIGTDKKTLGDLYDRTPKDLISKVMLEEKIFMTWFSGRTVLLGDACHKLHPAGGQGAMTAMHDAMALANLIYALPSNSNKDIHQLFTDYQAERLPFVTEAFNSSRALAKGLEKGLGGMIALWISRFIPQWLWKIFWTKVAKVRPQIGFLPQIPLKGTVVPIVTKSTEKARAVYESRQGASSAASAL